MTVLDDNGKKLTRKKLDNDPLTLLSFIRQYPGPKRLAIETCYNWPLFHELFKNEVDEFHLLHAKKLRSVIESQAKTDGNDLRWLTTVPGMRGKILKYILLSELDNVDRFRHSRALVAYAGLIPKEHSSGEKNHKGHLRSECNQFLRWAILQAVLPAMRQDKGLRKYYQDVKERKNSSAARIAAARVLLESIYCVLKERRPYRMMQAVNRG
jgi:transposase